MSEPYRFPVLTGFPRVLEPGQRARRRWRGPLPVEFSASEVAGIGFVLKSNDARLQVWVRLLDGRELHLNLSRQPRAQLEWLQSMLAWVPKPTPSNRESASWMEVVT